ncbi:hypothetical protein FMUND_13002 [Fusarium mundagurra]|uniref:Heterokaryon incompatibility domain-containing protein n=1 Tax=Fusarium mundagurra TaxID=1567541 RepID=A0A8H5Y263_9HYPO|nr:hypothetical protein FMUND_13002 [Fusarium mundagurra]
MPTRLLDLGNAKSNTWRLYHKPEYVRYAALSHRWSPKTRKLRTRDVKNYGNPQPDSALPQNYQDIISICRAIPMRYLWIDSLCIIQDDGGSEFRKEAPLMTDIYQYAYLTLSICWDFPGLSIFRECQPRSIPRPKLRLDDKVHESVSESDEWVFAEETERSELLVHVSGAPINQRGWVLQERCLSRRLLYLGNEQLYWECDGCIGSEASPGDIPNGGGRKSILDLTTVDREIAWSWTLKQYTASDLTYESDRLIAIAGLAKSIAARTGETYFAGIWLESWMQCLLWEPVKKRARRSLSKPGEVAIVPPSWSWLGFSGSVESTCGWGPKISYTEPNSFESDDYQPLALLSEAIFIPDTNDPFSSIEGASLKIRCLLLPVTFTGTLHRYEQPCTFRHEPDIESSSVGIDCFRLQVCEQSDKMCVTYVFSFSQPVDTDISVRYFLVPLYLYLGEPKILYEKSCCYGLVLKELLRRGTRQFMRVGIWRDKLQNDHHSSQLSPIISNTIVKQGIGKKSAVSDGSLTEKERVFDSKLGEYAADHVDSKVQFPMKIVKMKLEHQQETGEGNEKSGIPGSEAAEQKVNQAVEEEETILRDEEVECSLLPHFTTAKWDTISLV